MKSTTLYNLDNEERELKAENICYIQRIIMIPFPISPIDGMDRCTFDHLYSMDSMVSIDMLAKDDEDELEIFRDTLRDDDIRGILINHGNEFYRYTQAEQVKHHNRAHLPYIRIREWWINLKHVNDYMIYNTNEDNDTDYFALCFGDPSKWDGALVLNSVNPALINNNDDSWQDMNPVNATEEIVEILNNKGLKRRMNELPHGIKELYDEDDKVTAFVMMNKIEEILESDKNT